MTVNSGATRFAFPKKIIRSLEAARRDMVFRRAMRRFMQHPELALEPGSKLVSDLIYGWGNESWSADNGYVVSCLKHAMDAPGAILECGSGLTTLLVGVIAQRSGHALWSLEHSQEWGERVTKYLREFNITAARLCTIPLRDYGDFVWYEPPLAAMPTQFTLVVCDGPPGSTRGGRYGMVPVMRERLASGSVILLDDCERVHEREIAQRWRETLNARYEMRGTSKQHVVITLP